MKTMRKILVILCLLFLIAGNTFSQVGGFYNSAVDLGDTVIIKLETKEGTIEWQKSYDKINWTAIVGIEDEFEFVADQTTYFRVKTSIGNCNPYYSDSISVTVYGEMHDIDGNTYKTIQIGDQVWMAENLRVTHFADGNPIVLAEHDSSWAYIGTDMAYCWYNNDSTTYATTGALYNWSAAMYGANSSELVPSGVQGVCPDGWHLPSDMEWQILDQTLGVPSNEISREDWIGSNEGAKMANSSHLWKKGSLIASSEFGTSGFNAKPTGDRTWDDESIFFGFGIYGTWWSATWFTSKRDNIWTRYLQFDRQNIRRGGTWKWNGNSIRCVKN